MVKQADRRKAFATKKAIREHYGVSATTVANWSSHYDFPKVASPENIDDFLRVYKPRSAAERIDVNPGGTELTRYGTYDQMVVRLRHQQSIVRRIFEIYGHSDEAEEAATLFVACTSALFEGACSDLEQLLTAKPDKKVRPLIDAHSDYGAGYPEFTWLETIKDLDAENDEIERCRDQNRKTRYRN